MCGPGWSTSRRVCRVRRFRSARSRARVAERREPANGPGGDDRRGPRERRVHADGRPPLRLPLPVGRLLFGGGPPTGSEASPRPVARPVKRRRPGGIPRTTLTRYNRRRPVIGRDEVNGYDVAGEEIISAPEPEPEPDENGNGDDQ